MGGLGSLSRVYGGWVFFPGIIPSQLCHFPKKYQCVEDLRGFLFSAEAQGQVHVSELRSTSHFCVLSNEAILSRHV